MASRYGRKKRRRHLEQIAALAQALATSAEEGFKQRRMRELAAEQLTTLMRRVKGWEEHLRDHLGAATALSFQPSDRRERLLGELRYIDPLDPTHFERVLAPIAHNIETMIRIVGGLSDTDLQQLRRYVHLQIVVGKDEPWLVNGKPVHWNYAISERSLHGGLTEYQILHIAEQIALQFAKRLMAEFRVKRPEPSATPVKGSSEIDQSQRVGDDGT